MSSDVADTASIWDRCYTQETATKYRQNLFSEGDRPLQFSSNITDAWQNEKHSFTDSFLKHNWVGRLDSSRHLIAGT